MQQLNVRMVVQQALLARNMTMTLVDRYARQLRWRSWSRILDSLPGLAESSVLDLGCGIGDVAAEFSARGASVIGIDINEEFVACASGRRIRNAEFRQADLRTFRDPSCHVDGIWSSFTAAFFPAFREVLETWIEHLRPGGWLALTEIDDLFGHHPLTARTRELLGQYAHDAIKHGRYDFHMGRKMPALIEACGLKMVSHFEIPDSELSFAGRAAPDVQEAWRDRFDQMRLLQDFCGAEFKEVRDDFLTCLGRDDHYCTATVQCCIAVLNRPASSDEYHE